MKFSNILLVVALSVVSGPVVAYEHFLRNEHGIDIEGAGSGTDLNTRATETPEERQLRFLVSGLSRGLQNDEEGLDELLAPADLDTMSKFLEELYNPMLDAKCFNDKYHIPSPDKLELYMDYKRIFNWGLDNNKRSPLFDESTGVSSNRFPGMCLRMAFHDNSIVANRKPAQEWVEKQISDTGEWIGPELFMQQSGGDASVLTCKPERYHPNNNYDQTASRILHAFQSKEEQPKGPGIGDGQSLMSKYNMSYADALHNCALAALKFMTDDRTNNKPLKIEVTDEERKTLMQIQSQFSFGRKDACYITKDQDLLSSPDGLGANYRRPLCGKSEFLPGVTLDAAGVSEWFESRGMSVGVWLSLFGTHTALDNFSSDKMIRWYGLPGKDYFEDFVGCPFHELTAPVEDPEDPGCVWTPSKNSSDGIDDGINDGINEEEEWLLVQSDCAVSIDLIQKTNNPELDLLEKQMQVYIDNPGAWLADIICALDHLGGNDADCVGPYGVTSPQKSKFGSFWRNDYPELS